MIQRRRPVILLNALASRAGGPIQRVEQVVARAGDAWGADVYVIRDPDTDMRIPAGADIRLPVSLARLPATIRRAFEGRIVRRAAQHVGAHAVAHYGTYIPTRVAPGVKNILYFVNMAPWGPSPNASRPRHRIRRLLFEATLDRADGVIVQSHAAREQLERRYPALMGRVRVVHNGCSIPALTRTLPLRDFVLVGHVYGHRRLHDVVRAYALLAPALRARHRLVVVGSRALDARAVRMLDTIIATTGLADRVLFTGPRSRQQVLELVAGACALVSYAEVENGPNAVMEAAALGAPLILAELPVHREFGTSSTRFVRDHGELARAMEAAARDAETLEPDPLVPAQDSWSDHVRAFGAALLDLGVKELNADVADPACPFGQ